MLKQRKNKSFKYKPRFYKDSSAISDETEVEQDFVSKWKHENSNKKRPSKGIVSIRTLVLALVLLLICMYILDSKFR